MEEDAIKQIKEQFGREWSCSCGGSFESARVEVISKTKNTLLARYSCQICGREQMFTVPADVDRGTDKTPAVEVPDGAITSDDVLDIKREVAEVSIVQIKALGKKKTLVKSQASKIAPH